MKKDLQLNYTGVCWYCGRPFKSNRATAKYCSKDHNAMYHNYGPCTIPDTKIDGVTIDFDYFLKPFYNNIGFIHSYEPNGWSITFYELTLRRRFGYWGPLPLGEELVLAGSFLIKTVREKESRSCHFQMKPFTKMVSEEKRTAVIIEASDLVKLRLQQEDDPKPAIEHPAEVQPSHEKVAFEQEVADNVMDLDGSATVVSSLDLERKKLKTLHLKGKWQEFIGNPTPNFAAMVFGKPKMGKSYLCIAFAGYLAKEHGKVLYVAAEEGVEGTMQKKILDTGVAHKNLSIADKLPSSLEQYKFIFLDSVNKMGLEPESLNALRNANKQAAFIFIFQTTKQGHFKGANTFQHDVDIVIEVPERGKAVQFGRFNQGSELQIFELLGGE